MKKTYDREDRIGFEIRDNKLELILPEFMKNKGLNEGQKTREKIKYFRLLRKYNLSSRELHKEGLYDLMNNQRETYIFSIFEAYYLLLMDFMDLGPFTFTEIKNNKNKKGRINWNKTMNKSNLLVSGESLIYCNPYYTNNNIRYNHPLTIIYGMHLLKIEEATGIRLNIHSQYREKIKNKKNTISISRTLQYYRSRVYSDRQRKIIKLLDIINGNNRRLDKISTNNNLHYLENINNLWEFMLKAVLDDEYYNYNKYFPAGIYDLYIEDRAYKKVGLRIIPDIIKEHNKALYIIDAKNYLPHIHKNLPGSGDINKQILYRYFLSKEFNKSNKYELKDIKNVFLLPDDLQGHIVRKIGTHKICNMKNTLGDIYLYQVDFNHVVDAYLNNDKGLKAVILDSIQCAAPTTNYLGGKV